MPAAHAPRPADSRLASARWWPLAAGVALAGALAANYWHILGAGGRALWHLKGDSWKNVYTFVYHALHDRSWSHTDAYLYPDGEHVAMADAQPLLSNLAGLGVELGLLGERSLTWLVLALPIASVLAHAAVAYALLRRLGCRRAWASGWAVVVAGMCPQVMRLDGHFGLAYGWVLPALALLWWRARERDYALLPAALTVGLLTAAAFVHPYYLAIGAALLLALCALDAVGPYHARDRWRPLALAAATAVAPAALLLGFLQLSDVHPDRASTPAGLTQYTSDPLALLCDLRQPHWRWVSEHLVAIRSLDLEGLAYLGLPLVVGALLGAAAWWRRGLPVWRRLGALEAANRPAWAAPAWCMAAAGLALAVYSWGFPMGVRAPVLDTLVELSGPLKQFRSLGRFAWGTYAVWTPLAAAALTHVLLRLRYGAWLLAVALAFGALEVYHFWSEHRREVNEHTMLRDRDAIRAAFADEEVAAVLPLPFYLIGADDLYAEELEAASYTGSYPSLALGAGNLGVHLSRTPTSLALRQYEFVEVWSNVPQALEAAPPGAGFVFALDKRALAQFEWVRRANASLKAIGDLRFENELVQLYYLDAAAIRTLAADHRYAAVRDWSDLSSIAALRADTLYGRVAPGVLRLDFDGLPNALGIAGTGAHVLTRALDTTLALPSAMHAERYVLVGAQVKLAAPLQTRTRFTAESLDAAGQVLAAQRDEVRGFVRGIDRGWALVQVNQELPEGTAALRIAVEPHAEATSTVLVDELVVRPHGTQAVFVLPQGVRIVNGAVWRPLP